MNFAIKLAINQLIIVAVHILIELLRPGDARV